MSTVILVAGVASAIVIVGGLALYRRLIWLDPIDALKMLHAKIIHAIQWARYYNHQAISYRARKNHIAAAEALVQRSRRLRTARKLSVQAKTIQQKT
ncbi:hypothetical protein [Pseudomonas sp. NPDC089569]|uniref:hypothetical protein n=1 Tax=Pseudomonas sp. NPDC089569 TaxID=3390722 RepID=UPI003D03813D